MTALPGVLRRCLLLVVALGGVGLALLGTADVASADDPPGPAIRLLATQRVELLPQRALCWNIYRFSHPAGDRRPASGYTLQPLTLSYQLQGMGQLEYAGGPTRTYGPGEGFFLGNDNWFAVRNIGPGPRTAVVFLFSCRPVPDDQTELVQLGNTGLLPGVQLSSQPHRVTLTEVTGPPGSRTPVATSSGPLTAYFLEGQVAVTVAGVRKVYGAGDTVVIPPDTTYQTATVGSATARALVLTLNPEASVGVTPTTLVPTTLPRTGDDLLPTAAVGVLGLLVVVAGVRLRSTRT